MPSVQTYYIIANAFTVMDIADPLVEQAEATEDAIAVWERLYELAPDDWFCLVRDNQRIVGYLTFDDEFNPGDRKSVGELANPLTPDQIVPVSTPILDMLPLFEKHFFFFALDRNDITHVVSFMHLDKLPVKLCFFSLFMELESGMLKRLTHNTLDAERYLRYLSSTRLEKAKQLCKLKYKRETAERLLLCTTFIDKMNIFQSDDDLSKCLPFRSKSEGDRFFSTVEKMRNQIAHSDSILSVISNPAEMNAFIVALNAVISSVSLTDE